MVVAQTVLFVVRLTLDRFLDAIANDIEEGGNKNTVTAGNFYVGGSGELQHIRLQAFQSIYAHDRLGFYAKQAITGDLDETNTKQLSLVIGVLLKTVVDVQTSRLLSIH